MTTHETWKPVPGFPSYYASNTGRIGSVKQLSPNATHIRVMKGFAKSTSLLQYKLRVDGRYVTVSGQRLVALAYHENPQNLRYAQRIDPDKSDAPKNIRWTSFAGK